MRALTLYRGLIAVGYPAVWLMLRWRLARGKEEAARLDERVGIAGLPRPDGALIWLHAASVGEAVSVLVLIRRLLERSPHVAVLVTTGTVTSAQLMAERLPAGAIHQYVPIDRLAWVRRFLDYWQPDAALWVESELWPNLVVETARRGVPIALINGRMSARSHRRWRRMPGLARDLMSAFRVVLAQDETVARRLADLGAARVETTGSLKYAADPLPHDIAEAERLGREIGDRPCWVAASTHEDEEVAAVTAHRLAVKVTPGLLTVVVPRHPSRGTALAEEMRRGGLGVAQRSKGEPIEAATQIYLADTLGELGLFYRLAELVFVGGSLAPHGCHNLLEPAQLGCAVLHGPDISNMQSIAADLKNGGGAVCVADKDALSHQVAVLLADDTRRHKLAENAARVATEKQDIIDLVMDALAPVLDAVGDPVEPPEEMGPVEKSHARA
ncbi:MAG: 3-deoxy-D-manno-octulosonic acid transferase [Alphaproteobacteria bacterium]|nr:3-deoxy-D-manno-octulosonic acid transferase [Alphaproteobacteria bacterium]